MKARKQIYGCAEPLEFPVLTDEECADRLAMGYRQSFDEGCLVTWDEMEMRLAKLFERKRAQSA